MEIFKEQKMGPLEWVQKTKNASIEEWKGDETNWNISTWVIQEANTVIYYEYKIKQQWNKKQDRDLTSAHLYRKGEDSN